MVSKDANNSAKNNKQKRFFKDAVASAILIYDIQTLDNYVKKYVNYTQFQVF